MADPTFLTDEATPEHAAPLVDLIEEAGAAATAHFAQLPPGEEAAAYVTLTAPTAYGTVPLGMWGFQRAADGSVSLMGALPEVTLHG
ncbi:hypothetical protein ACIQTN_29510 [Streptomyces werraensis]|uniref:hypothetical protein n=1 Tax=Streptomyces werraensis TaxID=68284 RepID=UPI0037FC1098